MNNKRIPLVTIAIPTYNRAQGFLREALKSAINQSYQNLEIIVSDNCSTDNTQQIVSAICDDRIKYLKHTVNIGAANNFNYCVEQAQGEYFLLLHDDDLIDSDFIETCIESLQGNYEIGVVFTGARVIDEYGRITNETPNPCIGLSPEAFIICWLEGKVGLYLCNSLYNTKWLKKLGGFKSKTNLLQDAVADILLSWHYGRSDIKEIKASFRRHSNNRGGDPETLAAWCEDSLFVMEVLSSLPVERKDVLREKAVRYFAKKNYLLSKQMPSFFERVKAYHLINKKFKYEFSPAKYFYNYEIRPLKNRMMNFALK